MNLTELAQALRMIGVDETLVVLGGHADLAWCVELAEDGIWEVFWSERGNKNDLVRFETESSACTLLLGRLAYSQLVAGAIQRSPG